MIGERFLAGLRDRIDAQFAACMALDQSQGSDPGETCRRGLKGLYWAFLVLSSVIDGALGLLLAGVVADFWDGWVAVAVACVSALALIAMTAKVHAYIDGLGRSGGGAAGP